MIRWLRSWFDGSRKVLVDIEFMPAPPPVEIPPLPPSVAAPKVAPRPAPRVDLGACLTEGTAALDSGQFEQAELLFRTAADAYPNEFWPAYWLATKLIREGRVTEATVAFRELVNAFPDEPFSYVGLAIAYLGTHEYRQVEDAVEAGMARCGYDYWLGFNHAQCADNQFDYATADVRWAKLVEAFPEDPGALGRWARVLTSLGEYDRVEALLSAATEEMASHPQVLFSLAMLKSARQLHAEAVVLWRQLRALKPNDMEVQTAWGQAEQAAQFALPEESATAKGAEASGESILAGFVSLGEDCEFGLFQRHFGVEPLGLFRWASVKPRHLSKLLEDGVEAIADPANTTLAIDLHQNVYYLCMPSYSLQFNTMVKAQTVDEVAFLTEQNRRTKFLLRHLLGQFEDGEKIFVYKCNGPLDRSAARRLGDALRRYGDVRLLYVAEAATAAESGLLERVDSGLVIGLLTGLGTQNGAWKIPYERWQALCEAAQTAFADPVSAPESELVIEDDSPEA